MSKQLIVIGNGFDLTCGLESSYKNFHEKNDPEATEMAIEHDEKVLEAFNRNDGNYIIETFGKKDEILLKDNFWYDFMSKNYYDYRCDDWTDFEKMLNEALTYVCNNYYDYYQNRIVPLHKLGLKSKDSVIRELVVNKLVKIEGQPVERKEFVKKVMNRLYFGGISGNGQIKWTKAFPMDLPAKQVGKYVVRTGLKQFLVYLLSDLMEYEKFFCSYLEKKIEEDKDYLKNANALFKEMTEDLKVKKTNTQVLSFNYTNPISKKNLKNTKKYVNIHGDLISGKVIFGINGNVIKDKSELLSFTKAYRIIERNNLGLDFDEPIDLIKFMGHGLAEADYSYFQSIFDKIDLYNGKAKIIFYYYIYEEDERRKIIETCKKNAFKLIQDYGNTLENKEHGRNLITKLILENRFLIKEIKFKKRG